MKKNIKQIMLCIFIFFAAQAAAQQVSVSGKVTDAEGNPVALASLLVQAPGDSSALAAVVTSSTGEFSFRVQLRPQAILSVRHLLFEEERQALSLQKDTTVSIVLTPRDHLLEGVTVTASKPRYTRSGGNMVVHVEQVPGSETDNVFDLLRKLPGVIASDHQGLSLHGMGVEVQVDGRSMAYMDAATLLKALPASALSQIELISVKGAEHDGATEAIINLKTKRKSIDGYFGMAGGAGRYYSKDMNLAVGQAFAMLKAKNITFNTTFNAEYINVKKLSGTDSTWFGDAQESLIFDATMAVKEFHLSNYSNLIWDIKPGQALAVNLSLFGAGFDRTDAGTYQNRINQTETSTTTKRDAPRLLTSANAEYQLGSMLKIYYGYVRGNSDYMDDIENTYTNAPALSIAHNEDNVEEQHMGKLDFNRKYLNEKLEVKVGTKATFATQENASRYVPNTSIAQDYAFNAKENISASYASLAYEIIPSRVFATVGIRSEYTSYSIEDITAGVSTKPSYWNYFPHGHIDIRVASWYSALPYITSGIERPNYRILLPGKRYTTDYSYSVGNPYINPTKYYTFAVSNTFLDAINLRLSYRIEEDKINSIKINKGGGVTENTYMNCADLQTFGLLSSFTFEELFNNKLSGSINYTWKKGKYGNLRHGFVIPEGKNEHDDMKLSSFIDFRFTKNMGVNANLSYQIKNKELQIEREPYASLDLGVSMNLLKSKQLSVNLEVVDIFNSVNKQYTLYYDNNVLVSNMALPSQYVQLKVFYRFSGGKRVEQKEVETNDIKRFTR
ncbi:MAG: outer membrane beta-barrel protein [Prevotellaceae bacterium]|jgi:hypothetical protein|nr:outer membrane beta-barrel protein [Prevotellaceae bacterium]